MARKRTTVVDEALPTDELLETADEEQDEEDAKPAKRSRGTRDREDIGKAIAKGISEGLQQMAPPKKIKPGSSAFDPRSAFRSHKGPRLMGTVYDNGIPLKEESLYDEEINLCNAIKRSGRYLDRFVEVQVSDDSGARVVLIRYLDRNIDDRIARMRKWLDFGQLLQKIVTEQNQLVTATR